MWVSAGIKKAKDFFGFADQADETVKGQRKTQETWKEGVDLIKRDPDKAIHQIWKAQDMQRHDIQQIQKTLKKGAKVAK